MKSFEYQEKLNFARDIIIALVTSAFVGLLLCVLSIKLNIVALIIVIFALFIFIIHSYTRFFKSEVGLLWLMFLFPLLPYHMGYDFGRYLPVMKIHRILTIFMIFYWLIKTKSVKESIKTFPLTKIFIFVFISMAFSSIISSSKIRSFFYLSTFGIEYFLFSVMFFDILKDKEKQEKIFFLIAIASTLIAMIGIIEYFTGKNIYTSITPFRQEIEYVLTEQLREGRIRIKGPFDHPITFGIFLTLSSVPIMYFYKTRRGMFNKIFYIALFFIISFAIFLTKSRSAVVFGCIMWIVFLSLKARRELIVLCMFFMLFFIQPFFLQELKDKIIFIVQSSFFPSKIGTQEMLSSTEYRIQLYDALMNLIMQNPIFGYGKIDFGKYYIDNFYLYFTLSFGILGLISFSCLMLLILYNATFLFIKGNRENIKLFGVAMIGTLIGLFFVWLTVSLESYFYLIWLYVGILSRLYVDEKNNVKSHLKSKKGVCT